MGIKENEEEDEVAKQATQGLETPSGKTVIANYITVNYASKNGKMPKTTVGNTMLN